MEKKISKYFSQAFQIQNSESLPPACRLYVGREAVNVAHGDLVTFLKFICLYLELSIGFQL